MVKRRDSPIMSSRNKRDECKLTSDEASKQNYDGTKTGAYARFRDKHGRYLLTGHAVSGVEEA